MSKYVESAAELIGKTPLLKLNGYTKKEELLTLIFC